MKLHVFWNSLFKWEKIWNPDFALNEWVILFLVSDLEIPVICVLLISTYCKHCFVWWSVHFILAVVIGGINSKRETQAPKQPWWWVTMGTASIWKGDDQIPVCYYSKDKTVWYLWSWQKIAFNCLIDFFLSYSIHVYLNYPFPLINSFL